MIKSKTIEKFQDKLDPITDGYISMLDSLFKKSFINFLFLLMLTPILYMFVVAVFPKVGLIINSIILIYYSYHYILKLTSKTELDLYIYKLVIIILSIFEFILISEVFFSGKKAASEKKDND